MENIDETIEDISSSRMNLRERPQRKAKQQTSKNEELKFMEDFDPERSNREKKKLKRKLPSSSKNSLYDEYGHLRKNGRDICDCMDTACYGCFFECDICGSNKCGPTCRVNRRFFYDCITFDGKDAVIHNTIRHK